MNKHYSFRRPSGFTLIELMIVVAVVAILASIAIPSYMDYIVRSTIPEATGQLSNRRVIMENFFLDNRTYTGGCTTAMTAATANFTYTCSLTAASGTTPAGYQLTAVGTVGGRMDGFIFTIDQSGAKTTATVPSSWKIPNPNTCWVVRKAGNCT